MPFLFPEDQLPVFLLFGRKKEEATAPYIILPAHTFSLNKLMWLDSAYAISSPPTWQQHGTGSAWARATKYY